MSKKKFKPTRAMVRVLQVYLSLEPNEVPTNTLLAMEAGISRQAIVGWLRKLSFQRWWEKQVEKYTSARLDRVWTAMYQGAIKGDASNAKLFIERFDPKYKPTRKTEQEHSFKLPTLEDAKPQREQLGQAIGRFETLRWGSVN